MEFYLDLKNNNDYSSLEEAANIIKAGGVVLFPTETVYGLGANALDSNAVEKIFIAKGRNPKNPINLLVSNMKMVEMVSSNINELEYKLMEAFFPGPFTIILQKNSKVPSIVTAGKDTVGVRMPSNEIAKTLVEYAGVPIAAPSANVSGKPSGTNFNDIYNDFKDKVDYMIDGGSSSIGIESTIVQIIDNIPHILRPGSVTESQIKAVCGISPIKDYEINPSNLPSNKLKHYSLNSKSILVYSNDNERLTSKIKEIASDYTSPIIVCSSENINTYKDLKVINMGSTFDEIAQRLFATLKEADNFSPDIIIIEGIEQVGLGSAIMNRLINACENNYIEV